MMFQSTPRRRATRLACAGGHIVAVSIHAPPEEGDGSCPGGRDRRREVSIHAPRRRATFYGRRARGCLEGVSIHAPPEEGDVEGASVLESLRRCFNPRPRRRATIVGLLRYGLSPCFDPHPPGGGAARRHDRSRTASIRLSFESTPPRRRATSLLTNYNDRAQ